MKIYYFVDTMLLAYYLNLESFWNFATTQFFNDIDCKRPPNPETTYLIETVSNEFNHVINKILGRLNDKIKEWYNLEDGLFEDFKSKIESDRNLKQEGLIQYVLAMYSEMQEKDNPRIDYAIVNHLTYNVISSGIIINMVENLRAKTVNWIKLYKGPLNNDPVFQRFHQFCKRDRDIHTFDEDHLSVAIFEANRNQQDHFVFYTNDKKWRDADFEGKISNQFNINNLEIIKVEFTFWEGWVERIHPETQKQVQTMYTYDIDKNRSKLNPPND